MYTKILFCLFLGTLGSRWDAQAHRTINVLNLLPFYSGWYGGLAGSQGLITKNFVAKLNNSEYFGPESKYVQIDGFNYSDINLATLPNTPEGRQQLNCALAKTDILLWSYVPQANIDKFSSEIENWIKSHRGAALILLDYLEQERLSKKLGFTLGWKDVPEFQTTVDYKGPFGTVKTGKPLKTAYYTLFFKSWPSNAVQLTKNAYGDPTGFQADNIYAFGDSNLIWDRYASEGFYDDKCGSCTNSDQSKFFCNVFADLVRIALASNNNSKDICPSDDDEKEEEVTYSYIAFGPTA